MRETGREGSTLPQLEEEFNFKINSPHWRYLKRRFCFLSSRHKKTWTDISEECRCREQCCCTRYTLGRDPNWETFLIEYYKSLSPNQSAQFVIFSREPESFFNELKRIPHATEDIPLITADTEAQTWNRFRQPVGWSSTPLILTLYYFIHQWFLKLYYYFR